MHTTRDFYAQRQEQDLNAQLTGAAKALLCHHVTRRRCCALGPSESAADLAAKHRFVSVGLHAGHNRPGPLGVMHSSLHHVSVRSGSQGSESLVHMSDPSASMFHVYGTWTAAGCAYPSSAQVCTDVHPVGIRQVWQAQMDVP